MVNTPDVMTLTFDVLIHQIDTSCDGHRLIDFAVEMVVVLFVVALILLESRVILHATLLADCDSWNTHVKLGLVELLRNDTGGGRTGGCAGKILLGELDGIGVSLWAGEGIALVLVLASNLCSLVGIVGGRETSIGMVFGFGTIIADEVICALRRHVND